MSVNISNPKYSIHYFLQNNLTAITMAKKVFFKIISIRLKVLIFKTFKNF